jgi:ferredoxin
MYQVTIDSARCKKDGLCAMICPHDVIQQEECIACGHCVAICPQDAISHSEFPATTIRPIQFEQMPTTEQVMALLKTRRSIRAFRDKPLAKETIETIIDGARFAPSGHNSQSTEFLVVQDRSCAEPGICDGHRVSEVRNQTFCQPIIQNTRAACRPGKGREWPARNTRIQADDTVV